MFASSHLLAYKHNSRYNKIACWYECAHCDHKTTLTNPFSQTITSQNHSNVHINYKSLCVTNPKVRIICNMFDEHIQDFTIDSKILFYVCTHSEYKSTKWK